MSNPDPWFMEERPIPGLSMPLQIYRMPYRDDKGAAHPDQPSHLTYAVSYGQTGHRFRLDELRAILATAEQAEADLA